MEKKETKTKKILEFSKSKIKKLARNVFEERLKYFGLEDSLFDL